ncbi:hypothetical protein [Runella zeae]|uniref:hypothetical protein n=1 Tax=Runella zeae TaxID=94255 RepID=UPI0012F7601F|nr:hypothetical protein [Runella zeae]
MPNFTPNHNLGQAAQASSRTIFRDGYGIASPTHSISNSVRDARPDFTPNHNLAQASPRPELCFGTATAQRLRRIL